MKTNHHFASTAVTLALLVAVPVHAQSLGGVVGGMRGMTGGAFGGGFGTGGSVVNGRPDVAISGRANAGVNGFGRVDKTAAAGVPSATNNAARAKGEVSEAGSKAVGGGELAKSKADGVASSVGDDLSRSVSAASVTSGDEGEAIRSAGAHGGLDGALSGSQAPAKPQSANPKPPMSSEPKTTAKPDSPSKARQPSIERDSGSLTANRNSSAPSDVDEPPHGMGSHGRTDARASASAEASATH